jgi:hypothetical protein
MAERLSSPRFAVKLEGLDEYEVQANGADLVRWDLTAAKHKWPEMGKAPFLWSTFVTWAASSRTGIVTDTWDQYLARVEAVEALDQSTDVDPTDPDPESGS